MNKKLYIIALGLSATLFASGVVYGMTSVDVKNHFETGIVDIDLTEYQLVGDTEELWEDNPTVLPGDIISKIPRVSNDGNDCYVRSKITFRETDEIDASNLIGISDKWILADDGYYYYNEILPHGEDVDIFEAISIPDDFSQKNQNKQFYVDIDVDAIQSKNFTPDFKLASPWGSVEILECEKEGMYDVSTFKQSDKKTFKITYQGDAEKLVKNEEDFFLNFPYLMPGDTYSDTVILGNDGDDPIKLHFRSVAEDNSDLLDKIQLKITTQIGAETKVFYEGNLRAATLNQDSILGTLAKDSNGEFTFEIHVPHELNNEYSISSSYVQWIFSTEVCEVPDNPQTGDSRNVEMYFILMLISGLTLMALIILPYLNDRREEDRDG